MLITKKYKIVKHKSKWNVVEINFDVPRVWATIHKTKAEAKRQVLVEAKFNFEEGVDRVWVYTDSQGFSKYSYTILPDLTIIDETKKELRQ